MRNIDIVRRAGKNLRQSKVRTLLTSFAIAIGSFAIITSLALGNGARSYISSLIGVNISERTLQVSRKSDLINVSGVTDRGIKEYNESVDNLYGIEIETLSKEDITKIEKIDGVKNVAPYQMLSMKYMTIEGIDKKWTTMLRAYDPLIANEITEGKIPEQGTQIADNQIIIPEKNLKDLNINAKDIIGKKITIHFSLPVTEENIKKATDLTDYNNLEITRDFTVAAVLKETSFALNEGVLMISQNNFNNIGDEITKGTASYQKYLSSTIEIEEGLNPDSMKERIQNETGFTVMTAQDLQSMMFQFVNILQIIVISFGVLALMVSVFGIINTMYVSVLERISQIGLMKSLGMRNKHVAKMFRYEAGWIGFIGATLGVVLSWIIGTIINPMLSDIIGFKDITLLQYDILQAIGLIILLIIVAIVSSFLPARKAAKLDPIEALRTE